MARANRQSEKEGNHFEMRQSIVDWPILTGQDRAKLILNDWRFTLCMLLIIFSSAVTIGIETEYAALDPSQSAGSLVFNILEIIYTIFFLMELALRVYALRWNVFWNESDGMWNFFDFIVVVISVVGVVSQAVAGGVGTLHVTLLLRVLRLARILKTLRVVRVVRFVGSLRRLVSSIMATLRTLVWAILLLGLLLYLFGIAFTDVVTMHRHNVIVRTGIDPVSSLIWWSSLGPSMSTLFEAVTGGVNWAEPVEPLVAIHPAWGLLFWLFVAFATLAVMNSITATFCQSAIEFAQHDKELATWSALSQHEKYARKLQLLFLEIDTDHSGLITKSELDNVLRQENFQAYFESLEIDTSDAWLLFKLLDSDRNGVLELEEFVSGCLQLKGQAKAIQCAKLECDNRQLRRMLEEFMEDMWSHFNCGAPSPTSRMGADLTFPASPASWKFTPSSKAESPGGLWQDDAADGASPSFGRGFRRPALHKRLLHSGSSLGSLGSVEEGGTVGVQTPRDGKARPPPRWTMPRGRQQSK